MKSHRRMMSRAATSWCAAICTLSCATHAPAMLDEAPLPAPEAAAVLPIDTLSAVLPGHTTARRLVTVSSTFDSRLVTLHVSEGQHVRKGDVIARLDDRTIVATTALALEEAFHHGRLERMIATLRHAERSLERLREVDARGAATVEELELAETEVALARADVREARELQRAAMKKFIESSTSLETYTIRAPFDGTILSTSVEPGAVVTSGEPIAEIATLDELTVELHLPASTAAHLRPGDHYALELGVPVNHLVRARVRYVEPRVDLASSTMRTVLDLESTPLMIPLGTLAGPAERQLTDAERTALYPMLFGRTERMATVDSGSE